MSTASASPAAVDPRFPIGKFHRTETNLSDHASHIDVLAALPENLRAAVEGLGHSQLDTPYRDGGWTVRQVVHHVADSHMNAYIRTRLALTEDWPTIKPYNEKLWAELPDALTASPDLSLRLLDALHYRWVLLLRTLSDDQWERGYTHPESGRQSIAQVVAMYDWHCRHHTAHIVELRKRMGW
jgi:hypothetical protein